jgi:hypothetical protein
MKQLLAIAILGMLLTGCSKSVDSKSKTFTYPLALGNQWTYSSVGTWEHGVPLVTDTTGIGELVATVEQVDTTATGTTLYTVRAVWTGSSMPYGIPECTYFNHPDGLYRHSCDQPPGDGSGFALPKIPADSRNPWALLPPIYLAGPAGPAMLSGAMAPADTLPLVLAYPQHKGMSWLVHDSDDVWAYWVSKTIEARETLVTPAGSFDCWRIRTRVGGGPWSTVLGIDYMSPEGLVKRRASERFPNNGNWISTLTLTSFKLY